MNWLSFLSYTVVSVFTPGPNTISSLSNASRYGFLRSANYRFGIGCGFYIITLIAGLFCAALLDFIPSIRPYMLALGSAYILWMAWKNFTSRPMAENDAPARDNTFLSGMLLQLVNVKLMVLSLTAMSVYVVPYSSSPLFIAAMGFIISFTSFTSITCWAAFGAVFSRVLRNHQRGANTVFALLLVWCAVSLYL